ncbi:hypothetical protein UFOVP1279_35 [uncultured Caudovirales phage]|uniref:Uncharacterized protein n=1 Tax=uncultured Caudovirales phage TaxID=2100421 RepID=A0A6J5RC48_9CAUD|nr:hypothetical protein UFOVP1279_35 [uncultured Caudovirales phage]
MSEIRRLTLKLYNENNSFIANIPFDGAGTNYDRRLNQPGVANVAVPAQAAVSSELLYGRYIRFLEDNVAVFTMVIEELEVVVVDKTPDASTVIAKGRGWIAELSDARVYPPNGAGVLPMSDNVYFNYAHKDLDRSTWVQPVVDENVFKYDNFFGTPVDSSGIRPETPGWPDIFTGWLAPWNADGAGSHTVGVMYFTNYFYAPVTADYTFVVAADNVGDHWIDNVFMLRTTDWSQASSIGVLLTIGWHRYTCRVENTEQRVNGALVPGNPLNPIGLAVVGYGAILSRYLINDNIILRSSYGAAHGTFGGGGWSEYEGWLCLPYTEYTPGFTIGKVMRLLVQAEKARGAEVGVPLSGGLSGWTLGFTDTHDSAGTAWPIIPEIIAKVGDDYLSVFTQFSDQGLMDFAARPTTRVIDAWLIGEQGNYHTDPASPPELSVSPGGGASNISRASVSGKR